MPKDMSSTPVLRSLKSEVVGKVTVTQVDQIGNDPSDAEFFGMGGTARNVYHKRHLED